MNKINCLNLPVLKRQVSKYTKPHHIHASESLGGVKISSRKIKVPTEFTENGVHIAMFDEPQVTVTFFFKFLSVHGVACRILAPQPRMEPRPLAVRTWSPTH